MCFLPRSLAARSASCSRSSSRLRKSRKDRDTYCGRNVKPRMRVNRISFESSVRELQGKRLVNYPFAGGWRYGILGG